MQPKLYQPSCGEEENKDGTNIVNLILDQRVLDCANKNLKQLYVQSGGSEEELDKHLACKQSCHQLTVSHPYQSGKTERNYGQSNKTVIKIFYSTTTVKVFTESFNFQFFVFLATSCGAAGMVFGAALMDVFNELLRIYNRIWTALKCVEKHQYDINTHISTSIKKETDDKNIIESNPNFFQDDVRSTQQITAERQTEDNTLQHHNDANNNEQKTSTVRGFLILFMIALFIWASCKLHKVYLDDPVTFEMGISDIETFPLPSLYICRENSSLIQNLSFLTNCKIKGISAQCNQLVKQIFEFKTVSCVILGNESIMLANNGFSQRQFPDFEITMESNNNHYFLIRDQNDPAQLDSLNNFFQFNKAPLMTLTYVPYAIVDLPKRCLSQKKANKVKEDKLIHNVNVSNSVDISNPKAGKSFPCRYYSYSARSDSMQDSQNFTEIKLEVYCSSSLLTTLTTKDRGIPFIMTTAYYGAFIGINASNCAAAILLIIIYCFEHFQRNKNNKTHSSGPISMEEFLY